MIRSSFEREKNRFGRTCITTGQIFWLNKWIEFLEIVDPTVLAMPEAEFEAPLLPFVIEKFHPNTLRLVNWWKMFLSTKPFYQFQTVLHTNITNTYFMNRADTHLNFALWKHKMPSTSAISSTSHLIKQVCHACPHAKTLSRRSSKSNGLNINLKMNIIIYM